MVTTTMPLVRAERFTEREEGIILKFLVKDETGPGGIISRVDRVFHQYGCSFAVKNPQKGGVVLISGIFSLENAEKVITEFFTPTNVIKKEFEGKLLARE